METPSAKQQVPVYHHHVVLVRPKQWIHHGVGCPAQEFFLRRPRPPRRRRRPRPSWPAAALHCRPRRNRIRTPQPPPCERDGIVCGQLSRSCRPPAVGVGGRGSACPACLLLSPSASSAPRPLRFGCTCKETSFFFPIFLGASFATANRDRSCNTMPGKKSY